MCILCLTEKLWVINFIHDDNYLNEKSESINADILPNFYLRMSRDECGSSSTLYECTVFSKIYFCDILSYIGISDLACSACQLIGLYISYRGPRWMKFWLCKSFLCFVLGINSCTLWLMIAEAWNLKLHIYIYIYIILYYIILYYIYIDTHTHTPECYINVKLKVVNLSCCYCPYINDIALFNV